MAVETIGMIARDGRPPLSTRLSKMAFFEGEGYRSRDAVEEENALRIEAAGVDIRNEADALLIPNAQTDPILDVTLNLLWEVSKRAN